jgi:hypothetical protein
MNDVTDLPYIVILDWDGTIAGKVDFQSQRFALQQYYKKYGLKHKADNRVPKAFLPNSYLIRPGFAAFIKDLTDHYRGNIYFFIYTASEKTWAHKEIQWVEKAHGIKFQRPIFTRDDCVTDNVGSYRKSIQHIFPRILRSIGKKSLSKQDKQEMIKNRIMIIDNNSVYNDLQDHLLLCPDYSYMVFENLLEEIPVSYLKHPHVRQYVLTLINNGMICPFFTSKDDINHTMYQKYEWLSIKCKHISEENKYFMKDVFFKYLRKLIIKNQLRVFSGNVVKQLQEAIWKKMPKK